MAEKLKFPKISSLDTDDKDKFVAEEKKLEDNLPDNEVMEEEITYSKGKQRIKQKVIKLRDYDIQ